MQTYLPERDHLCHDHGGPYQFDPLAQQAAVGTEDIELARFQPIEGSHTYIFNAKYFKWIFLTKMPETINKTTYSAK